MQLSQSDKDTVEHIYCVFKEFDSKDRVNSETALALTRIFFQLPDDEEPAEDDTDQ
jgi:hypothetical protein